MLHERDTDLTRPCLQLQTDLQAVLRRLARCRRRPRAGRSGVADRQQLDPGAVDAHFDLVRLGGSAREFDGDEVVAVEGNVVSEHRTAARPHRQPIDVHILGKLLREPVGIDEHRNLRVAYRQPADFLRRGEIAFEQRR